MPMVMSSWLSDPIKPETSGGDIEIKYVGMMPDAIPTYIPNRNLPAYRLQNYIWYACRTIANMPNTSSISIVLFSPYLSQSGCMRKEHE